VEIRDGGSGGADPSRAPVRSGRRDRVEAIEDDSADEPAGGRTSLRVELPLPSARRPLTHSAAPIISTARPTVTAPVEENKPIPRPSARLSFRPRRAFDRAEEVVLACLIESVTVSVAGCLVWTSGVTLPSILKSCASWPTFFKTRSPCRARELRVRYVQKTRQP